MGYKRQIYHYTKEKPITFTDNLQANREAASNDIKLQTILDFVAIRLGLTQGEIYYVSKLFAGNDAVQKDAYPLFDVFKALSQISSPN